MKRLLIFTCCAIFAFCAATLHAEETSPLEFKHYMHRIFDSYNHAEISRLLGKDQIADIHLREMEEAIAMAQQHIPGKNKDGSRLDRKLFLARITQLQSMAADLRGAVKYGSNELSKSFSKEVFNMCVTCHEEVRLEHLFRIPQQTTLFGEYMHKVSVHLDQARIYSESKDSADRIEKQLKLIIYYLDLIKTISEDQGPSGATMDKNRFIHRLEEIEGRLKKNINEKKKIDLEGIRKDLNGLCVACHEAEGIK